MADTVEWKDIKFKEEELADFRETFNTFDADGNGSVTTEELKILFEKLGEPVAGYKLREMIAEVDKDNSNTIEWDEFLDMMRKARASGGKAVGTLYRVAGKAKGLRKLSGSSAASSLDTSHSYSEEETFAFADWINYALADDADLKSKLPIPTDTPEGAEKLFEKIKDGVLLAKLINTAVPDTIDERAINKTKLNTFNIGENQTLVVNSAAAIGVNTTNIGPNDLMAGTPHIALGLLWQVIRIGLFAKINIKSCPGLSRLLHDGEELSDLLALSPEELLLRWVNYHLDQAGCSKRIKNFSGDIKDSEAYVYLLTQIAPRELGVDTSAMSELDLERRAAMMLANAEKMDCHKFVQPRDIVKGNPKLNLAFVANLFNQYPGLLPDEDFQDFDMDDVAGETREERTFRNWMNSLGVSPFVHHLYPDLASGNVLLQLIDKVRPGIVNWDKVNKPPFKKIGAQMKKLENCNYAVELGLQLKFSLVGIGGSDIYDCNKTLTLGFVWQLMRAYTLKLLAEISGDAGKVVTDQDIVDFVNEKLSSNSKQTISGFRDDYISTARPVLHLVDIIKPGTINWGDVNDAGSEEEKLANAKYAVSMCRKINAGVYALPEDIVEVKPKMLLTIFACLQVRALRGK